MRDVDVMEAERMAQAKARALRDTEQLGKAVEPTRSYGDQAGCAMEATTSAQGSYLNERLTLHNIEDAMKYQPWTRAQTEDGDAVRDALTLAAKAILRHCPDGAFRSVALRNIIDARMNANAAISFRGRF